MLRMKSWKRLNLKWTGFVSRCITVTTTLHPHPTHTFSTQVTMTNPPSFWFESFSVSVFSNWMQTNVKLTNANAHYFSRSRTRDTHTNLPNANATHKFWYHISVLAFRGVSKLILPKQQSKQRKKREWNWDGDDGTKRQRVKEVEVSKQNFLFLLFSFNFFFRTFVCVIMCLRWKYEVTVLKMTCRGVQPIVGVYDRTNDLLLTRHFRHAKNECKAKKENRTNTKHCVTIN